MADRKNIPQENVPGRYYVDGDCIDCDICRSNAPQFFTRDDAGGYSYVHRQPVTPEEIAIAEETLHGCPTDDIGNDGLES